MGPIRNKLYAGLAVLMVMLGALAISGLVGVYSYRGLVKGLRGRAEELPLASLLTRQIADLRVTLAKWPTTVVWTDSGISRSETWLVRDEFEQRLLAAVKTLNNYREEVSSRTEAGAALSETTFERDTAETIHQGINEIQQRLQEPGWSDDPVLLNQLRNELDGLQAQAESLPSHLHSQLLSLAAEVRSEYHALMAVNWFATAAAVGLLIAFLSLFYRWIMWPLTELVAGSRRVAGGDFDYRIKLETRDEMAELGEAFNSMTARFQEIRDDLDNQVQERTRQVIRNEQLASVGFLAAGVAHEINNPLASIAMCAESLEGRMADLRAAADENVGDVDIDALGETLDVTGRYLSMIQTEAFRCKEITEKLLDFSRLGNAQRQLTDLREIVQQVIDMVSHLGKYQDRRIIFAKATFSSLPILAQVVPQEIKQVVLNLITNALDCLDTNGQLTISAEANGEWAELDFNDNGCGMTTETMTHLFEPFFTRKRQGQGTGLGLSITYRIVTDHGGQIIAHSEGPGRGAQFTVTLPLANAISAPSVQPKELSHRHQTAA
jgi:two-component system NtrC family sensor kinase